MEEGKRHNTLWFRVDNRLVHGQIIETWLPYTGATRLVVCNERLASDPFQQQIMLLAVPSRITVDFVPAAGLEAVLEAGRARHEKILTLFATCGDAQNAFSLGVAIHTLNIGNLHYCPGKLQLCDHVALDAGDMQCLSFFKQQGVQLDFRCVPNDPVQVREWQ